MGNTFGREDIDYNSEIDLRHFELLRCVGRGAFGKVRIVEKRDTKKLYALKYINKLQCIKMRATANIFRERAILEEIDHPFVVNLRFAFQDDENMFMVMDLMMGGDLRFHLDRNGSFSEDAMRLIALELCAAIGYLHQRNIVHRDLKPDNVLLDESGHVHITDFNIAVHYNSKVLTSQSGTLAYMAPELFTGQGYSWPIDYWSLGVLLFECLFSVRPFGGSSDESIKNAIKSEPISIPNVHSLGGKYSEISSACSSFLQQLLERDIRSRLGCGPSGTDALRNHAWFQGADWDAVVRMQYSPPYIPDASKANFDATYDLEELLLEENPLTYRPRKKKEQAAQGVEVTASQLEAQRTSLGSATAPPAKRMTAKERVQLELDYIDQNFKLFDSSIFDRYRGFSNTQTLQVSDEVPSWVKNLDSPPHATNYTPVRATPSMLGSTENIAASDHEGKPSPSNTRSLPTNFSPETINMCDAFQFSTKPAHARLDNAISMSAGFDYDDRHMSGLHRDALTTSSGLGLQDLSDLRKSISPSQRSFPPQHNLTNIQRD